MFGIPDSDFASLRERAERRAKAHLDAMDQRVMLDVRVLVGEGRVLEPGGADRRLAFGVDLVPTSDKRFEAGGV
jgi:hypothetical protein